MFLALPKCFFFKLILFIKCHDLFLGLLRSRNDNIFYKKSDSHHFHLHSAFAIGTVTLCTVTPDTEVNCLQVSLPVESRIH